MIEPADQPRWSTEAVAPSARLMAEWDGAILGTGMVDGHTWTVFTRPGVSVPLLTPGVPGLDADLPEIAPHPSLQGKFGIGMEFGVPMSATVVGDGTIIIHGFNAEDRRQTAVVSRIDTYDQPGGVQRRLLGEWVAPPGHALTHTPKYFTSATYLPNLGLWSATAVEYTGVGINGAMGYGATSADGFATWTKLIDFRTTDPPVVFPNGVTMDRFKHLHRLRPFEFERDGMWHIGAIAMLGDGNRGVLLRIESTGSDYAQPGATFTYQALKDNGRNQLTDAMPLDPSDGLSGPAVFLLGDDGGQPDVTIASLSGDFLFDRVVFRSTMSFSRPTLNSLPFAYRMIRLGNGSIVAGRNSDQATRSGGTIPVAPDGIWVSDPTGEYWAVVHQQPGNYRGIGIGGTNMAWIRSALSVPRPEKLWRIGAPHLQQSIQLGPEGVDLYDVAQAYRPEYAQIVTGQSLPKGAPATSRIWRVTSDTIPGSTLFHDAIVDAALLPGTIATAVLWVKPVDPVVRLRDFNITIKQFLADGTAPVDEVRAVSLHRNDWTRIILPTTIRDPGSIRLQLRLGARGTPDPFRPLDLYLTDPQLIAGGQVFIQPAMDGPGAPKTRGDRLTCLLPSMGNMWTVMIWGTEAPDFVCSLYESDASYVAVTRTPDPDSGSILHGLWTRVTLTDPAGQSRSSTRRDVFFPTQTFLAVTRDQAGAIHAYVGRGMGSDPVIGAPTRAEQIDLPTTGLSPTEVRFGTPDWSQVFQGTVHRVEAIPGRALTADQINVRMGQGLTVHPVVSAGG